MIFFFSLNLFLGRLTCREEAQGASQSVELCSKAVRTAFKNAFLCFQPLGSSKYSREQLFHGCQTWENGNTFITCNNKKLLITFQLHLLCLLHLIKRNKYIEQRRKRDTCKAHERKSVMKKSKSVWEVSARESETVASSRIWTVSQGHKHEKQPWLGKEP